VPEEADRINEPRDGRQCQDASGRGSFLSRRSIRGEKPEGEQSATAGLGQPRHQRVAPALETDHRERLCSSVKPRAAAEDALRTLRSCPTPRSRPTPRSASEGRRGERPLANPARAPRPEGYPYSPANVDSQTRSNHPTACTRRSPEGHRESLVGCVAMLLVEIRRVHDRRPLSLRLRSRCSCRFSTAT
jgi:hypothetical protein